MSLLPLPLGVGGGDLPVGDRVTHGHVPLRRDQERQEDGGAEADVVERVGELDQIYPDLTVS